jgi:hypothetical protein
MRIAFENAAIHVSTGIAFVGVTEHVTLISRSLAGEIPFHPGREARAAATAQPGAFHFVDHIVRRHAVEHFAERLIDADVKRLVDAFGINPAAVAQNDFGLLLEEVDVVDTSDRFIAFGIASDQPIDYFSANGVVFDF